MPAIQGNFGLTMPRTASVDEYLVPAPDLAGAYRSGQQMALQKKQQEALEADRLFRRNQAEQDRQAALAQRYGESLVVDPESGVPDYNASERNLQQRLMKEKMAYQFGYQYGLSGAATALTPAEAELLNTPHGRLGLSTAMSKKGDSDMVMNRWLEQQKAITKRYEDLENKRTERAREIEEERSNRDFVRNLLSGKTDKERKATYRWERDGAKVTGTREEYEADMAAEEKAMRDAEMTSIEDEQIGLIEAELKKLRELRARGESIDIEDTDMPVPKIQKNTAWADDPARAEEILKQKLENVKKAKRDKQKAGLGVLRNSENGIGIDAEETEGGDVIVPYRPGSAPSRKPRSTNQDEAADYISDETPTVAKARRVDDLQLAIDEAMAMSGTKPRVPTVGDARRIDDLQLAIADALDRRNFRRPVSVSDSRKIDELRNFIAELDAQDVALESETAEFSQSRRFGDVKNRSESPGILGAGRRSAATNAKREEIRKQKEKALSQLKEILDSLE